MFSTHYDFIKKKKKKLINNKLWSLDSSDTPNRRETKKQQLPRKAATPALNDVIVFQEKLPDIHTHTHIHKYTIEDNYSSFNFYSVSIPIMDGLCPIFPLLE